MKIHHLLCAVSAAVLASCSNTNEPGTEPADELGKAVINIAVNNKVASRDIRDLNSSENLDNVEIVKLNIMEGESDVTAAVVTDCQEAPYSINPTSESSVTLSGLKAGTNYDVTAYGYNNDNDGVAVADGKITLLEKETASVYPSAGSYKNKTVAEYFAAQNSFKTNGNGSYPEVIKLELTRQVAALLVYAKNIPATAGEDGEKVTSLELRGSSTLLSYPLSDASTQPGGATYVFDAQEGTVATVENSILMGRFVAPFEGASEGSLKLCLCDKDGNVLRSWVIKDDNNATDFNINGNEFYAIGTKATAEEAGEPIDLSNNSIHEITITINNAWSVVNNMTIKQ